jgi:hypothetical protein
MGVQSGKSCVEVRTHVVNSNLTWAAQLHKGQPITIPEVPFRFRRYL